MDALIEFLFKYRPIIFEKGHFAFGASWPTRVVVLVVGLVALAAIVTYQRVSLRGTVADRRILIGMRALILVILAVTLLRPILLVSAALTKRNVVGVLIDDSRSMRVADMDGRTRADVVRSLLGSPDSALYKGLSQKFIVRLFHLADGGGQVAKVGDLAFDGARTRLAPALENVREDLAGVPVAGLVLVSDGADNAPGDLGETLLSLNARKVPVFTVGVGRDRFAKDIEISRIEAPSTVLKDASLVISVDIAQRGFGGNKVQLVVEDSGRIISTDSITLPRDGEAMTTRVRAPTVGSGPHFFTVRVVPQPGEMITENNARTMLVVVRNERKKILYVEGEPRFELKFLRNAVDDDQNLQLVTMMRAAKNKFLRLNVDDSLELVAGFPRTREELFAYHGIVLGSIEASFFTLDQMRMVSDFVSERGGGLLMLGGRLSFAEGGYAGTPIADALPVELPAEREGKPEFHEVKVGLTPAGAIYPTTQIGKNEIESAKEWKTMPVVTSVNHVTRAKPGAGTLLAGTGTGDDRTIVLASQRYGRGKALAFPIQDSWLWQMDASVPVGNTTYRAFWRQALRSLVNDVPGRVTLTMADQSVINEPVQLTAEVTDKTYLKVNNAEVKATVLAPSGDVLEVPLDWSGKRDGEYQAAYTPTERGVYRVEVTAESPVDSAKSNTAFIDVGTPATEYFGAELRTSLLRRVAEETGGRYYTPANAAALPKDLVYSEGGNTAPERLDLWDMPIMFILLLGVMAGEWGYRRTRGLV